MAIEPDRVAAIALLDSLYGALNHGEAVRSTGVAVDGGMAR
ncbi:MAG: hypothetical protein WDA75_03425 [Candidatus Latescibacterota bacterium]|jgi:hypothetical protein